MHILLFLWIAVLCLLGFARSHAHDDPKFFGRAALNFNAIALPEIAVWVDKVVKED